MNTLTTVIDSEEAWQVEETSATLAAEELEQVGGGHVDQNRLAPL